MKTVVLEDQSGKRVIIYEGHSDLQEQLRNALKYRETFHTTVNVKRDDLVHSFIIVNVQKIYITLYVGPISVPIWIQGFDKHNSEMSILCDMTNIEENDDETRQQSLF